MRPQEEAFLGAGSWEGLSGRPLPMTQFFTLLQQGGERSWLNIVDLIHHEVCSVYPPCTLLQRAASLHHCLGLGITQIHACFHGL